MSCHHPFNHLPGSFTKLHAFDILGKVIQPAEQAERIAKCRESGMPEACRDPQPGLLTQLHHDAIFNSLEVDGEGGVSARAVPIARSNLDSHPVFVAQELGVQVAAVKFRH